MIDTNVVSEMRKKSKANSGVLAFFKAATDEGRRLYLSTISVGELRRGVELTQAGTIDVTPAKPKLPEKGKSGG